MIRANDIAVSIRTVLPFWAHRHRLKIVRTMIPAIVVAGVPDPVLAGPPTTMLGALLAPLLLPPPADKLAMENMLVDETEAISRAFWICAAFALHTLVVAVVLDFTKFGTAIAVNKPIVATTIIISTSVKPRSLVFTLLTPSLF